MKPAPANSGYSPAINSLLPAMFEAALADFPNAAHRTGAIVTTPIGS